MLIDPNGLFNGDRICACSYEAQLHFPRLLAASNGYGRIELSYSKLMEKAYGRTKGQPTKEVLKRMFHEFHANFLLFVYQAPDGTVWGQWDIPSRYLPDYKTSIDKKSPAPVWAEFTAFRAAYREMIRAKNLDSNDSLIPKDLPNLPKSSEDLETFGSGIGVGNGVGVGEGVGEVSSPAQPELTESEKPEKMADPRHTPFKEAVHEHWRATVPASEEAPWNGSEGRALDNLLRANPKLSLDQFKQCLANRAQSAVQASDRPRRWLETVTDYMSGPKDEYGKPLQKKPREPGVRGRSVPSSQETQAKLRREALEFWEDLMKDGNPRYEREAPNWVRQELESRVQ